MFWGEYNCFTMLFLVSAIQWGESAMYTYISPPSWSSSHHPSIPLGHHRARAELPVLYTLALCFTHDSVSMSLLISQSVTPSLPFPCPTLNNAFMFPYYNLFLHTLSLLYFLLVFQISCVTGLIFWQTHNYFHTIKISLYFLWGWDKEACFESFAKIPILQSKTLTCQGPVRENTWSELRQTQNTFFRDLNQ